MTASARSLWPAAIALAALLAAPASGQSINGPTRDVVPRGRIAQLVWMLGTWECHVVDRKTPEYALKMSRRVALGPGGTEIFVLEQLPDFISRGRLGYSEKSRQWYEIDRVGEGPGKQQQTLVADTAALKPNGLTLEGAIPGQGKTTYPLRGVYSWVNHNGFIFRAQLLRRDGTWQTFEKHSCERTDEVPQPQ